MGELIDVGKLFLIKTTLSVHPNFYVFANDIVEATEKSKKIVDYLCNEKVVVTVSTMDTPLFDWKD